MSVTLKDVAQHCGVSLATASRALNGTGYVTSQTSDKVMAAAKALHYHPNLLAQQLASDRRRTVTFFHIGQSGRIRPNRVDSGFFLPLINAIGTMLVEYGYELHLAMRSVSDVHPADVLARTRRARNSAGFMIFYETQLDDRIVDEVKKIDVPVISIISDFRHLGVPLIYIDLETGTQVMTEHLIALGHSRLAHIMGREELPTAQVRRSGFVRAMSAASLPVDLIVPGGFDVRHGYEATHQLLKSPAPPTAIVGATDNVAIGSIRALADLGLTVPSDIAVTGVDDLEISPYLIPSLTTLRQPVKETGVQAAQLMIRMLSDEAVPLVTTIQPDLIVRESTAGPHWSYSGVGYHSQRDQ